MDRRHCLPLITSMRTDQATLHALRQALADIAADPELTAVKAALRLAGFALLTRGDYDAILALERQAQQAGYPALR
jgi:ABC-type phosphate/phosphonate transport system substrate-binding protein